MSEIWTEILIEVPADKTEEAGAIASMAAPGGIYIEDYSDLEAGAYEVAHSNLIDEELLRKDRTKGIIHVYISPDENPAEAVSFLSERLSAAKIENGLSERDCAQEDWMNNWKKYFHTAAVGRRLLIRPAWEEAVNPGDRAVLSIEPGPAFGTGTHATTRLCLEALEDFIFPGCAFLDIGSGSGILAVAAMLLGAGSAVGVDIDPTAVRTARENGLLNGFAEPALKFLQGDLTERVTGRYDVIAANIVADVITGLCGNIKEYMAPGGVFVASGIIDARESDVLRAFDSNGLKIISRAAEDGWVCLSAHNN